MRDVKIKNSIELHLRGFTLVEILLGILIFSIISGSLYFAVNVGFKSFKKGKVDFEIFQELRFCLKELRADIRSLFYDASFEGGVFEGNGNSFSCICYEPRGLCRIGYYKEAEGFVKSVDRIIWLDSFDEKRSMAFEKINVYHLADLVKRVDFEYLDSDYNWRDGWGVTGQYPRAVKITFYFEDIYGAEQKFQNVVSIPVGRKIFAVTK